MNRISVALRTVVEVENKGRKVARNSMSRASLREACMSAFDITAEQFDTEFNAAVEAGEISNWKGKGGSVILTADKPESRKFGPMSDRKPGFVYAKEKKAAALTAAVRGAVENCDGAL